MNLKYHPPGLVRFLIGKLKFIPVCNPDKCTGCKMCIQSCPGSAMTLCDSENRVLVDVPKCIECLCCQELCPQGAIEMKAQSWIGKLASKIFVREYA